MRGSTHRGSTEENKENEGAQGAEAAEMQKDCNRNGSKCNPAAYFFIACFLMASFTLAMSGPSPVPS